MADERDGRRLHRRHAVVELRQRLRVRRSRRLLRDGAPAPDAARATSAEWEVSMGGAARTAVRNAIDARITTDSHGRRPCRGRAE